VDLFAASEFNWERDGGPVKVTMETSMPYDGRVTLAFDCAPQVFDLYLRVPRWVEGTAGMLLNGKTVASGAPGTYVKISHRWQAGDRVEFRLSFAWKLTKYEGAEQVDGYERYAYEYGPLLMAFKGELDEEKHMLIRQEPEKLANMLRPNGQPLHFAIPGQPGIEMVPYLEIEPGMSFTSFPLFIKRAVNE
jgi:DUF1680 family protein